MEDKKLKNLAFYLKQERVIFPLHWVQDGKCSCAEEGCRSPGKHPLTGSGFYNATTDFSTVKAWHERYPSANWGMRTGSKENGGSGLVVVDIDEKSGGFNTWDLLRSDNPEPIETVTVVTGSGGRHLWFKYPEGKKVKSGNSLLGPGIDIKAEGGYVVIPPSETKNRYTFDLNPGNTPVEELPKWILERLNGSIKIEQKKPFHPIGERIGNTVKQGERHQALVSMAAALKKSGLKEEEIAASLQAVRDSRFANGDHETTDEEVQAVVSWVKDRSAKYSPTDMGNSERFLEQNRDEVQFCYKWNRWLAWDGKRWLLDDMADITRRAHNTVRGILLEAASETDDDRRRETAKHALLSESRFRTENMLEMAKPYISVEPSQLDSHPMLLNVQNGVLDLATGDLKPHNPDLSLPKIINAEYDQDAKCPCWEAFLRLITGEDEDLQLFLQKAVGYSLTGLTDEHALFFLFGVGKNGKTTFTEYLRRLFNDYSQRTDIEALMQHWDQGVAASPHVASLTGSRFVVASEMPEGRRLNESLIKDLTGGDSITARFLYSNPFTFLPTHKLWVFGNHEPRVSGTDEGFWRRMRVIPFKTVIQNPRPMSEILAEFDDEKSGILTWATVGCLLWQNNGLEMAQVVEEATTAYRTEQDVVAQFLTDCVETSSDYSVEKNKIYKTWSSWCEDNNEDIARKRSKRWFVQQLSSRGYQAGGHGRENLLGLRIRTS